MTAAAPDPVVTPPPPRPRWKRFAILTAVLLVAVAFGGVPALVQYQLWAGRSDLSRGDFPAALAHFQKAERLKPTHAETQFWLTRAYRKTGDLDGIRRSMEKARQLGYDDPERLRREWNLVLAETGRLSEVESRLPRMLMHPGDDGVEICRAFARGYCLSLRFDEALAVLDAWHTDFPDDPQPLIERGRIHSGNEKWPDAETAYRDALALDSSRAEAHRGLGESLRQQGRIEDAEASLQKAIALAPMEPSARISLAQIRFNRKDAEGALAVLAPILAETAENPDLLVLVAKCEIQAKRPDEAVQRLAPYVEHWPEDFATRYSLAQALRAAGRTSEAEAQFDVYSRLQESVPRLERLKREVRQRPDSAEVRYELGLLMWKHISRTEGVAWLQSALQFNPDHAGAHQALVEHYEKIGNHDLAERHRQAIAPGSVSLIPNISPTEGPSP